MPIAATIACARSPICLVDILAERGGQGLIVGAPAVSDALTQGTPTAGYSLASRDTVADCFEIGHYAHHGDAMIVISGCDKTGAAALMPLARTNAFGLVLYPGTSTPGRVSFGAWASKGNNITILDYAEARAANESGRLSGEELLEVERNVMPGSGTCGAMFTANTMSTIAESIGMMLPRGASHPADYDAGSDIHADVRAQARASVDALYRLMQAGIRPRDIMTERAFENAITTVYAMGGSTNMYLHLLAVAREAQVPITIERSSRSASASRMRSRQSARRTARSRSGGLSDRRRTPLDEGAARPQAQCCMATS